jgi:tetrahydromethanopterin S-methyltransferase subunit G
MGRRLTDMAIDKVALVDRGANGRTFAVLKRDEAAEGRTPAELAALWKAADAADPIATRASVIEKVKSWLGLAPEPVAKARTFAAVIAGQQLQDALYDSWYTLEDSLWSAIYAHDADGNDLTIEAKQALVAQNLDEFKAWLLAQMSDATSVAKRSDAGQEARSLDAWVRKVGKKISAARLAQLKEAHDALAAVIAEAEPSDDDDSKAEKRAQPEEDEMTGEELAKALEPVMNRLDAIDKRLPPEQPESPPAATVAKGEGSDPDEVPEPVAKVLEAIIDRLDTIEKRVDGTAGVRKSLDGQTEQPQPRAESWAKGIL